MRRESPHRDQKARRAPAFPGGSERPLQSNEAVRTNESNEQARAI